jgi:hypothetical protein
MITALNPTEFETGLKAYLDARFTSLALTVPRVNGEGIDGTVQPAVYIGLSTEIVQVADITVALRWPPHDPEAPGWYQPQMLLTVVSPLQVKGLEITHHAAVYNAIAASFPARPKDSAPAEDKTAWAALELQLSNAVLDATDDNYSVSGWKAATSTYSKQGDRIEQPFGLTLGVVHVDA